MAGAHPPPARAPNQERLPSIERLTVDGAAECDLVGKFQVAAVRHAARDARNLEPLPDSSRASKSAVASPSTDGRRCKDDLLDRVFRHAAWNSSRSGSSSGPMPSSGESRRPSTK